jgi:LysM repeat protein
MNRRGPIIPPGSPLLPVDKDRMRQRIVTFIGVAIFGFGVVAIALQGCNRTATPAANEQAESATSSLPVFETPLNSPLAATTNPAAVDAEAPPVRPAHVALPGTTEHRIAKGETFETMARKFHVSVKALETANPGVNPNRLQIGQVIMVPPAAVHGNLTTR